MSKYYRLKSEAVPFFKGDLSTEVLLLDDWRRHYHLDECALEELKPCYVTLGHIKEGSGSTSGWGREEGSRFHFTIHFPSMKHREYDDFTKGKITRQLMDKIQEQCDRLYREYADEKVATSE